MGSKEKEKQVTVSVTLEIVLTQEDIDDIMCGHWRVASLTGVMRQRL